MAALAAPAELSWESEPSGFHLRLSQTITMYFFKPACLLYEYRKTDEHSVSGSLLSLMPLLGLSPVKYFKG